MSYRWARMEPVPRLGSGIPLVARTAELRSLRAALDRAGRSEPSLVLLSGDAGVGKSRLLGELASAAAADGALVLSGRCLDLADGGLPYLPFAEALGSLVGSADTESAQAVHRRQALGRMLPQLADSAALDETAHRPAREGRDSGLLGGLDTARHEQDVGQLQLFDAVLGLLCELAQSRTLVVLLEDLHWADSSTRTLLSFLASRLRSCRVVLAASYRTEDVNRTHPLRPLVAELLRLDTVERVELGPLEAADARTLVTELSERELDGETLTRLAERGEGNPFFTEELVASSGSAQGWDELPAGLAEVLLARVERLARPAQDVVRALSVADGPAAHGALANVTGLGDAELDEALRAAVRDNVLVIDGQHYGFRHALLREAVYADLMPGERTRLHASYAARLRGNEHKRGGAALLAYHSMQSNDLPTALAASVRGAEEAGEWGGAPAAALRLTEKALRVWDAVPVGARPDGVDELLLLYRAANYASKSGQPERAIAYARSAIEALDDTVDTDRAARVWRRLVKTLSFQDDTEQEAAECIERAWQLVADAEPSVARARVLATRGEVLRGSGAPADAAWSARAAVADANAVGVPDAAIDALITMAVLVEWEGNVAEAREQFRAAIRQAQESGVVQEELRAWHFLGLSYDDQGEFAEALRIYRDGLGRAAETGLTWSVWGTELHTRESILTQTVGDWPTQADSDVWSGESGSVAARAGAGRVHTAVGQGRFAEAERLLAAMRPHWRTEVRMAISYAAATSELAYWRADYPRALHSVRETIELLDSFGPWQLGGLRLAALGVQACVATVEAGAEPAAGVDPIEVGGQLLEHARGCAVKGKPHAGTLGPEGRAWLARAEAAATGLGRPADPGRWADAVDAFGYGAVYEQAVCRWFHAKALLAAGAQAGVAAAAEELRAADEVARRLAAEPLAAAVRALARRAGIELAGAPRSAAGSNPLTARELAVLEQVAAGHTNRQAGQRLYISDKTVSVHLSRLMAKLGATTRAEAVAKAYDRGLLAHAHTQS